MLRCIAPAFCRWRYSHFSLDLQQWRYNNNGNNKKPNRILKAGIVTVAVVAVMYKLILFHAIWILYGLAEIVVSMFFSSYIYFVFIVWNKFVSFDTALNSLFLLWYIRRRDRQASIEREKMEPNYAKYEYSGIETRMILDILLNKMQSIWNKEKFCIASAHHSITMCTTVLRQTQRNTHYSIWS